MDLSQVNGEVEDCSFDDAEGESTDSSSSSPLINESCFSKNAEYEEICHKLRYLHEPKGIPSTPEEEVCLHAFTMIRQYHRNKVLTSRAVHEGTVFESKLGHWEYAMKGVASVISKIKGVEYGAVNLDKALKEVKVELDNAVTTAKDVVHSIETGYHAIAKTCAIQRSLEKADLQLTAGLALVKLKLDELENKMRHIRSAPKKDENGKGLHDNENDCTVCNTFEPVWFTPPPPLRLEDFQADNVTGRIKKIKSCLGLKPFICPWVVNATQAICGQRFKNLGQLHSHKKNDHVKADFYKHSRFGDVFDEKQKTCSLHKVFRVAGTGHNHCSGIKTQRPSARVRHMKNTLHLEDIMLNTLECPVCKTQFPTRASFIQHYDEPGGHKCATITGKAASTLEPTTTGCVKPETSSPPPKRALKRKLPHETPTGRTPALEKKRRTSRTSSCNPGTAHQQHPPAVPQQPAPVPLMAQNMTPEQARALFNMLQQQMDACLRSLAGNGSASNK